MKRPDKGKARSGDLRPRREIESVEVLRRHSAGIGDNRRSTNQIDASLTNRDVAEVVGLSGHT